MVASNFTRDRFDDVPRDKGRVGAHRAEYPRSNAWATLLWASVAAVVLFAAGVFGTLVVTDRITFGNSAAPESSVSAEPVVPRIDTTYTVLILNATPDEAKTAELTQVLLDAGWAKENIFAIDSDVTNFQKTTVYYPLLGDLSPAAGIAELLGGAETEKSDAYQMGDVDASAQLTVVIGADFVEP